MEFWSDIAANWSFVVANPVPFVSVAVLALTAGWGAATFIYRNRIETQKERVDRLKEKLEDAERRITERSAGAPKFDAREEPRFSFPESGFFGTNILGDAIPEIYVDREYSMAANVPAGRKLRVYLTGPKPIYLSDNMGAWVYAMAPRNWIGTTYNHDDQTQWFDAGTGAADLKFIPKRAGEIKIVVYQEGKSPTWTKTILVREN